MHAKWTGPILLLVAVAIVYFLPTSLLPAVGSEPAVWAEYLPTPRPSEPCDVCEPNNSLDRACGPLAPGESYRYFIRCTASRDDDLYYIDLDAPGSVTLDLTDIPSGTDYSIYLYDEHKELVCYSDQRGNDPEHVDCHLPKPGRYYVRVYPWKGCNGQAPYTLDVVYPAPVPPPVLTPTPPPPCNVHIDDFYGSSPYNDLGHPSGTEVNPPGCGDITVTHTGFELQLDYDVTSPGCTARYTTALSLYATPYELLAFEIKGSDQADLADTVVGLRDDGGREMGTKVGDSLNPVFTDTWLGGSVPLEAFATAIDTTRLDTLFVEFADTRGDGQGTIYLDSLRLETSLAPLIVDNFDDQAAPNALGGWPGIASDGAALDAFYTTGSTPDNSPASYAISYTVPSGGWALWETALSGLDVSTYAFLSFYVKGANGGEKANLYLQDGQDQSAYVDVEDYAPTGFIGTEWTLIKVPLWAFEGVTLTDLAKIKFVFEWAPMTGTMFLDHLSFVASTVLIDNFCDRDENNSLNREAGLFTSAPYCAAAVTPTLSSSRLRLDYDVSAGPACFSGYWSRTLLDLNPYRTLAVKVRGERCGQTAGISARTIPVQTDKLKLSDYLLDGITDQWQEAHIPLAASSAVTDWARSDSYVIVFDASQGASKGTTWWDDIALETACAPLWVDNFNDRDDVNALLGPSNVFGWESQITSTASIIHAYGDAGTGLVVSYTIPAGNYAGWETDLRNVDLSSYDRLVFDIKGGAPPETLHIYLKDADQARAFVSLDDYAHFSPEWHTVVIPVQHFGGLDLARIQKMQFLIEWEPAEVEGAFFLDNVRFLPSTECSQVTEHLVHLPAITRDHAPAKLDPVWDFELGTDGWTYQTYADSRATIAVQPTSFRSRWGNASLAMIVDLVGGDSQKSQGEAYVNLNSHPPSGASVPLDLECKPLSCWIYVPTCGLGDPVAPNVVELFVKDVNGRSEYGTPTRVVRNRWFEVKLRPSTLKPYEGWMETGFAPHAITQLGVRFRAVSDEAVYRGKVYIDACGWQEIDPGTGVAAEACRPDESAERRPPSSPRFEE